MTKRKIIIWSAASLFTLLASLAIFGVWVMNLVKPFEGETINFTNTTAANLAYLSQNQTPQRGNILAVVTSVDSMGTSGEPTGFELTELSRAYYVFEANGFNVDIASTKGGEPPMIVDGLGPYDYAFLNDQNAQNKLKNSIKVSEINSENYDAIYFAGGKGAMWDFPENPDIKRLVKGVHEKGGVIGAVCHGPAALVNVKLSDGSFLLKNKRVTGFTNNEELLLIKNARDVFPFLLQDKLKEQGAGFSEGPIYLNNVVIDQNLVTGQNPLSTWQMAESMITQLGYTPKKRALTAEEASDILLQALHKKGVDGAKEQMQFFIDNGVKLNRKLIAMYSMVSALQFDIGHSLNILSLLNDTHNYASNHINTNNDG